MLICQDHDPFEAYLGWGSLNIILQSIFGMTFNYINHMTLDYDSKWLWFFQEAVSTTRLEPSKPSSTIPGVEVPVGAIRKKPLLSMNSQKWLRCCWNFSPPEISRLFPDRSPTSWKSSRLLHRKSLSHMQGKVWWMRKVEVSWWRFRHWSPAGNISWSHEGWLDA